MLLCKCALILFLTACYVLLTDRGHLSWMSIAPILWVVLALVWQSLLSQRMGMVGLPQRIVFFLLLAVAFLAWWVSTWPTDSNLTTLTLTHSHSLSLSLSLLDIGNILLLLLQVYGLALCLACLGAMNLSAAALPLYKAHALLLATVNALQIALFLFILSPDALGPMHFPGSSSASFASLLLAALSRFRLALHPPKTFVPWRAAVSVYVNGHSCLLLLSYGWSALVVPADFWLRMLLLLCVGPTWLLLVPDAWPLPPGGSIAVYRLSTLSALGFLSYWGVLDIVWGVEEWWWLLLQLFLLILSLIPVVYAMVLWMKSSSRSQGADLLMMPVPLVTLPALIPALLFTASMSLRVCVCIVMTLSLVSHFRRKKRRKSSLKAL